MLKLKLKALLARLFAAGPPGGWWADLGSGWRLKGGGLLNPMTGQVMYFLAVIHPRRRVWLGLKRCPCYLCSYYGVFLN